MPDLDDLRAKFKTQTKIASVAMEVEYDLEGWSTGDLIEAVEELFDKARELGRPRGVLVIGDDKYEVK